MRNWHSSSSAQKRVKVIRLVDGAVLASEEGGEVLYRISPTGYRVLVDAERDEDGWPVKVWAKPSEKTTPELVVGLELVVVGVDGEEMRCTRSQCDTCGHGECQHFQGQREEGLLPGVFKPEWEVITRWTLPVSQ